MTQKAWLGLGGNIGDVRAALAVALRNLSAHQAIKVTGVSPLYKTPPWGVEDQPWFFNCCAEVVTKLAPEDLLFACQEQERLGKRERIQRWGPRTIDIDILVYESLEQFDPGLTLPHPRMLERAFVLVPLADIAPKLQIHNRTTKKWARESDQKGLEVVDTTNDWWRNTDAA